MIKNKKISWNKDKNHPKYDEWINKVKQIGKNNKGKKRIFTEKHKKNISNGLKGRKITWLDKIKKTRKIRGTNKKEKNPMYGNGWRIKGKLNGRWLGGISNGEYGLEFNDELKNKIRQRDNYTCQICNCEEKENLILSKQNLSVHHIDYNKKNNGECNLISLCTHCHSATNSNREEWIKFFSKKQIKLLKEKYGHIDVTIVSKDRPTELAILLQSIRTQDFPFSNIFIFDDRSGVPYQNYHFINCIINQLKLENHNVILWRNEIPYGVTRLRQIMIEKILEYSSNKLICRLDDDNLLEKDYFLRLIKCIDMGYDIASGIVPPCGFGQIKRETKFVKPFISDVRLNEKGEIIYFGDDCGHLYLEKEIIPSVNFRSMALIKREVHENVKYEDNLGFCSFREEQFFSFRALLAGYKIAVDTGAVALHLNCPSGGERTESYYSGLQKNHEILNNLCQKWFIKHGDFLEDYRRKFK